MSRKHSNNVVQQELSHYFGPFLAQDELLTFTLIHTACSTSISDLTISEVPQHATSVFSTPVQYITKKQSPYFLDRTPRLE